MGENSENHSVSQFSPPPSRELRSALRQPWLTLPAPLSAELSHRSYSRLQAYFPSQIYVSRHLLRVDVWITGTQTGKP